MHNSSARNFSMASVMVKCIFILCSLSSDDPEAQRRKIEAEIAAKNLGAAIGITAGAIIAANKNKDIDRDRQQTM